MGSEKDQKPLATYVSDTTEIQIFPREGLTEEQMQEALGWASGESKLPAHLLRLQLSPTTPAMPPPKSQSRTSDVLEGLPQTPDAKTYIGSSGTIELRRQDTQRGQRPAYKMKITPTYAPQKHQFTQELWDAYARALTNKEPNDSVRKRGVRVGETTMVSRERFLNFAQQLGITPHGSIYNSWGHIAPHDVRLIVAPTGNASGAYEIGALRALCPQAQITLLTTNEKPTVKVIERVGELEDLLSGVEITTPRCRFADGAIITGTQPFPYGDTIQEVPTVIDIYKDKRN